MSENQHKEETILMIKFSMNFILDTLKKSIQKNKMKVTEENSVEVPILSKTSEKKRKRKGGKWDEDWMQRFYLFQKKKGEDSFEVVSHELEHYHEMVKTIQRHHLPEIRKTNISLNGWTNWKYDRQWSVTNGCLQLTKQ